MWEQFVMFATWWTLAQFVLLAFFVIVGIFTGKPFAAPERDEWDEVYGDQPASPPEGYHRTGKDYRP